MLDGTTPNPIHKAGRLRRALPRGLPADLGYATTVTVAIILFGLMTMAIGYGLGHPAAWLSRAEFYVVFLMIRMTPTVPIVAVVACYAPTSGPRRYGWLVAGGALCMLWWYIVGKLLAPSGPWPGGIDFALAMFMVAATAYRSSARKTDNELVRRSIDAATLEAEIKRTKLRLLRAQMEPHFLFNTLATIRALSRIDPAATLDMIDNFMRYLSEALPQLRQDETTLANERELISAYLRIHQIRMGSRLHFDFDLPQELGSTRIPTLILLTLVENALKHGVDPLVAGGRIRVSAAREHSALVLRVVDSGTGMAAMEGHGLGLANIRRRLTGLYGDKAQLMLAAHAPSGVIATVMMPMSKRA